MMQKRTKRLVWIAIAAAVALTLYSTITIRFSQEGDRESHSVVDVTHESSRLKDCGSDGRTQREKISTFAVQNDHACFVRSIQEAHFAEDNVRADIAIDLAKAVDAYYQNSNHGSSILDEPYSRVIALNYLTPYVLTRGLKADIRAIRSDTLQLVKSENMATRRTALAVLSYFKDDKDIQIFREFLKSGSDEDLATSMFALVHNCSPLARNAISDGLGYANVRSYLTRYRDKETISRLIETECKLGSGSGEKPVPERVFR